MKKFLAATIIVLTIVFAYGSVNAQGFGGNQAGEKTGIGGNQSEEKSGFGGQESPMRGVFTLQNPLRANSIGQLIDDFISIFMYVVIIIAVLAIIWVGFQYVTAGGNAQKMKETTAKLGWLVVGIAIVIGARIIVNVIISTLEATGTVNNNVIQSARDAANGN